MSGLLAARPWLAHLQNEANVAFALTGAPVGKQLLRGITAHPHAAAH